MSVHMFRVYVGAGSIAITDLESRINDWVASNPEWESDAVSHTLTEHNTELDGTGEAYYHVDVRFIEEETKANLLQKLTDKIVNKVAWFRVGYHNCTHDENNHEPCLWGDSEEWTAKDVTIPAGVPELVA